VLRTGTVVIGAGQAGLAVSHELAAAGHDHVVLDRGRVAERWLSARWDSLRLLTPNWMSRLPGHRYTGTDPDGFMTARETAGYLQAYGASFTAPVRTGVDVREVRAAGAGYRVVTDAGSWSATSVVVATGAADRPARPALAHRLSTDLVQVHAAHYRRPGALPDGGVLVVGGSASGVQIADELNRAGRHVVLAVGAHTRLPRRYRGRDVLAWMERAGVFDQTVADVADVAAARRQPSLQLVGRPDHADLDLGVVAGRGVRLAGRLVAVDGHRVAFADDLSRSTAAADTWMHRVLDTVDEHIARTQTAAPAAVRPTPVPIATGPAALDLRAAGVRSVVWATGYRRSYPWLRVPVVAPGGDIVQRRGVTPAAGLYVVGMRFQHRRGSAFLDGVRHDARDVVGHLVAARHRAVA
jgi:putative flavoprotein involved in K+ transport